jgi:hypothetical protein
LTKDGDASRLLGVRSYYAVFCQRQLGTYYEEEINMVQAESSNCQEVLRGSILKGCASIIITVHHP